MKQRCRAVRELCCNDGPWGGAEVVCNILCVVVEYMRVGAGVHGEAVVVNERPVYPRWWSNKLIDGGVDHSGGRARGTG